MKYLLALVLPPVALMLSGCLVHATLCGILFLLSLITIPFFVGIIGWSVCSLWALAVIATTDPVKHNLHTMHALHQRPEPHEPPHTLAPH